jgi:hypothetical protein
MFQAALLSIIRSLNIVFTAVGICRASYAKVRMECISLVFIIRIYQDARSSECQISWIVKMQVRAGLETMQARQRDTIYAVICL